MALSALCLISVSAHAVDKTWTAGFNSALNNNNNWNPSPYPGLSDVMIFATKGSIPDLGVNINRAITGINFTGTGGWAIGGPAALGIGSAGVDNSGSGSNSIAAGLTLSGSSTWTVNSGTISVSGLVSGNATSGLVKNGSGNLTFSETNTYLGATTINAGTFFINGNQAAATGAVNVSDAVLGGTGTVGGATTLGANSALVAGANGFGVLGFASNLTLSNTSLVIMEISGTARGANYDAFDLASSSILTYDGTLNLVVNNTLGNGSVFDLFSFTQPRVGNWDAITIFGDAGYLGSFANVGGGNWQGNFGGQDFVFSANTGDLTIVPEPGTITLLGLGAMAILFRRRRVS